MPVRPFKQRRPPAWGKLIASTVFFLALAAAWRFTPLHEMVNAENAAHWARRVREMPGSIVILVLSYTVAAALMFPRPLLTLVTVIAFGPYQGTLYAGIGIMVAAMAFYYLGRFGSRKWVEKLAGDKTEALQEVMREHGIVSIFALNMVPAPPFSVQGIIAGALRMPAWQYAVGSFFGMLPSVLGWSVFGRQIAATFEDTGGVSITLVAAVAVLMIAFTIVVRRWFAKYSAQA